MTQNYAGLGGYTSIIQGRNIIATIASGGVGGGGYSGLITTNVSRNDFIANEPVVPAEPLVLTLDVSSSLLSERLVHLYLQMADNDSIVIDWGDNTTSTYETPAAYLLDASASEHTYDASGNYTVSISGLLTGFGGFNMGTGSYFLTGITSWGQLNLRSLETACNSIPNVPIPNSIPSSVVSLRQMFMNSSYDRSDISTWNVSNVTDMTEMFSNSQFNKDISSWFDSASYTGLIDVSMNQMFFESSFNQNISNWLVRSTNHDVFGIFDELYNPTFVDGNEPTDLSATVVDISSVTLTWNNNNDPVGIRIEFKLNSSSTWTAYEIITDTTTTVIDLDSATSYNFRVSAFKDGWTIATLPLTVVTLPEYPIDLSASDVNVNSATLSWTNISTPTDTRIQYSLDGTTWTTVTHGVLGTASTYTVTGLSADTFYYLQIATIVDTVTSIYAPSIQFSTFPNGPTEFFTTSISTTSIGLSWKNNSTPTDTLILYDVYDGLNPPTANPTYVGDVSSYNIVDLSAGTQYVFTVQTQNAFNLLSDSALELGYTKPEPVTNLAVSENTTGTEITLTWDTYPTAKAIVEYDLSGEGWAYAINLDISGTDTITITDLSASTDYQFRVSNIKYDILSEPSVITASTPAIPPIAPPSDLSGVDNLEGIAILTWNNNDIRADYFLLEYKLATQGWGDLSGSVLTAYTTYELTPALGQSFMYRVKALQNLGFGPPTNPSDRIESEPSNEFTLTVNVPVTPPTDLSGTDISGTVTLSWVINNPISDATLVESKLNSQGNTAWVAYASEGPIIESTVSLPTSNQLTDFRVRTIAGGIQSIGSNVITLYGGPTRPVLNQAIDDTSGNVVLTWRITDERSDSSIVQASLDDITWSALGSPITSPTNTLTIAPPALDTVYYYRVISVDGTFESVPSLSLNVEVISP
jgi:surface protein